MRGSAHQCGSETKSTTYPNTMDMLKIPDATKSIKKHICIGELDGFVEIELNSLDDVVRHGNQFIEMVEKAIQPNDLMAPHVTPSTTSTRSTTSATSVPSTLSTMSTPSAPSTMQVTTSTPRVTTSPITIDTVIPVDKDDLYPFMGSRYSLDPRKLMRLVKPLTLLGSMIGMKEAKQSIYQFVSLFLQNKTTSGMLNACIYGKPGMGKTDLGKILCMIYVALDIVPSQRFVLVKACDLIGKYVGETRQKTKKILDDADGGVLFIDEAYSLTSGSGGKFSYGKECIDTINQELSENRKKLVIIIAGYENEIKDSFFSMNQGLARRFPFKYVLKDYTKSELRDIFLRMIRLDDRLYLDQQVTDDEVMGLFADTTIFDNCGGDIENLITHIAFANSQRTLGKHPSMKNVCTKKDLACGLDGYKQHKKEQTGASEDIWHKMFT
jgi:hypothetical protein